jgi:hypothetical protein
MAQFPCSEHQDILGKQKFMAFFTRNLFYYSQVF